jgi:hypothetical protein
MSQAPFGIGADLATASFEACQPPTGRGSRCPTPPRAVFNWWPAAWRAYDLPQLPERRAYDTALTKAIAGLEQAQIVLAGIVRRIEDGEG